MPTSTDTKTQKLITLSDVLKDGKNKLNDHLKLANTITAQCTAIEVIVVPSVPSDWSDSNQKWFKKYKKNVETTQTTMKTWTNTLGPKITASVQGILNACNAITAFKSDLDLLNSMIKDKTFNSADVNVLPTLFNSILKQLDKGKKVALDIYDDSGTSATGPLVTFNNAISNDNQLIGSLVKKVNKAINANSEDIKNLNNKIADLQTDIVTYTTKLGYWKKWETTWAPIMIGVGAYFAFFGGVFVSLAGIAMEIDAAVEINKYKDKISKTNTKINTDNSDISNDKAVGLIMNTVANNITDIENSCSSIIESANQLNTWWATFYQKVQDVFTDFKQVSDQQLVNGKISSAQYQLWSLVYETYVTESYTAAKELTAYIEKAQDRLTQPFKTYEGSKKSSGS